MKRKYDSNDAVMAHQAVCTRLCLVSNSNSTLLEEYFAVCREYSDSAEARAVHSRFMFQLDAMRNLLTTQRPAAHATTSNHSGGPSSSGAGGMTPAGGSFAATSTGGATTNNSLLQSKMSRGGPALTHPRTMFTILPQDWSREHFKKLSQSWNAKSKEWAYTAIEGMVAWLLHHSAYEHYSSFVMVSSVTCYSKHHGMVFQKWATLHEAKNFVHALHLAMNAPLSRFAVPFAFAIELLGNPVVCLSLAPLDKPWSGWRSSPLARFHVDALCASVRLCYFSSSFAAANSATAFQTFTSQQQAGGRGGSSGDGTPGQQNGTISLEDETGMEFVVAIGADSRWYIVDARSLAGRQSYARRTFATMRVPRRELTFSLSGVISTPFSPNELILRFKLRVLADHLLTDSAFANGVPGLLSTILHQHGVRFGTYIYSFYLYLCAQERQHRDNVQATNRRNAMTPAAQLKAARFVLIKQAVVSELLARILKSLIREEFARHHQSKVFQKLMIDAISDQGQDEATSDRLLMSLNEPMIGLINMVLGAAFRFDQSVLQQRGTAAPSAGAPSTTNALGLSTRPNNTGNSPQTAFTFPTTNNNNLSARNANHHHQGSDAATTSREENSVLAPGLASFAPIHFTHTQQGQATNNPRSQSPQQFSAFNNNASVGPAKLGILGSVGATAATRFANVVLDEQFVEDAVFMMSDRYVSRVYGPGELQNELRLIGALTSHFAASMANNQQSDRGNVAGQVGNKFDLRPEDFDVTRTLQCLEELLGISLVVKGNTVVVDSNTNFFEGFFTLDTPGANALRSDITMTTVDLPICLMGGTAKSRLVEYAGLQQRIAAKLTSMIDVSLPTDILHYLATTVKAIHLHAYDAQVAHRGYILDEDYEEVLAVGQHVSIPPSPYGQQNQTAVVATIALRAAHLNAATDLQASLKQLMKYTESTRSLFDQASSPAGSAFVLADKIAVLCKICEKFVAPGLVVALETALTDLQLLTIDPFSRNEGGPAVDTAAVLGLPPTAQGTQLLMAHSSADSNGGPAAFTAALQQQQQLLQQRRGGRRRHTELKSVHAAYLQLVPLSLLVRHVMIPDERHSQGECLAAAVKYCCRRRDLIVEVYGEKSLESGIACNDIAAICSNNKFDFDKAEEEFERAVFILNECQPEGAALQITKNNLAFLCFRKAERLRKQRTQLRQQKSAQLGGVMITNNATAQTAQQISDEVHSLLAKAKLLLDEALANCHKMPVLDYGAALNNLASIKLFEGKFEEAKVLFTKTLEVTARLGRAAVEGGGPESGALDALVGEGGEQGGAGGNGGELPCRTHAMRNLKVLARRQYLSAVLRVQAAVRRFITNIRERKSFAHLKAIKPIQRLGRAFLIRLYLAQHYKFSGYYSWLRKPKLFTRKLEPVYGSMPVAARWEAWNRKLEHVAKLLQRNARAFRTRAQLGCLSNFLTSHLQKRRPKLIAEIRKRHVAILTSGALKFQLTLGLEALAQLYAICRLGVEKEVVLVRGSVRQYEANLFRFLWFSYEQSLRQAMCSEAERTLAQLVSDAGRTGFFSTWQRDRSMFGLTEFTLLESNVRQEFETLEESMRTVQLVHTAERLRCVALEDHVRRSIQVEAFTKFLSPNVWQVLQRTASGFLSRRRLARIKYLPEFEEEARRRILNEQSLSLNIAEIRRQAKEARFFHQESQGRDAITREAMLVFQPHRSPLALSYLEFHQRTLLELEAWRLRQQLCCKEQRTRLEYEHDTSRLQFVIGPEAMARKQWTMRCSEEWREEVQRVYVIACKDLQRQHVAFAMLMLSSKEQLLRRELQQDAQWKWVSQLEEPFRHGLLWLQEQKGWALLIERHQHEQRDRRLTAEARERHAQQRQALETKESLQRQNVMLPLEAVGRSYVVNDWLRCRSAMYLKERASLEPVLFLEWSQDAMLFVKDADAEGYQISLRERLVPLRQTFIQEQSVLEKMIATIRDESQRRVALERTQELDRFVLECVEHHKKLIVSSVAWIRSLSGLSSVVDDETTNRNRCMKDEAKAYRLAVSEGLMQLYQGLYCATPTAFVLLEELEARESLQREQQIVAHEASVAACCFGVPQEAMRGIHALHAEQELDLTALFLLSKFSKLVAGQMVPRSAQYLQKKHMDLRLQADSNLKKHAVMTLQRVGRAMLRRRRFGAFHFEEIRVHVQLIQRAARGYLCRFSPTMQLLQAMQRLTAEETRYRAAEEALENAARNMLQKQFSTFVGTHFLRMKSSSSSSATHHHHHHHNPHHHHSSNGNTTLKHSSVSATPPHHPPTHRSGSSPDGTTFPAPPSAPSTNPRRLPSSNHSSSTTSGGVDHGSRPGTASHHQPQPPPTKPSAHPRPTTASSSSNNAAAGGGTSTGGDPTKPRRGVGSGGGGGNFSRLFAVPAWQSQDLYSARIGIATANNNNNNPNNNNGNGGGSGEASSVGAQPLQVAPQPPPTSSLSAPLGTPPDQTQRRRLSLEEPFDNGVGPQTTPVHPRSSRLTTTTVAGTAASASASSPPLQSSAAAAQRATSPPSEQPPRVSSVSPTTTAEAKGSHEEPSEKKKKKKVSSHPPGEAGGSQQRSSGGVSSQSKSKKKGQDATAAPSSSSSSAVNAVTAAPPKGSKKKSQK